MPSLSARATRPVVQVFGKRLAAANSAEGLRREFGLISNLMLPARGAQRDNIQLDGLQCVRMSTEAGAHTGRGVLMFHGGGYVFGTTAGYSGTAGRVAKAARASVYLPDYALAPEYPHPAPARDGLKAYKAMLEKYAPDKLAVMGDSAGGGLSLATLQAARAEGLPMPACLVLWSPWLDVAGQSESMQTNRDTEILILPPTISRCAAWFAPKEKAADPAASPIHGDMRGLPPTLVQVSDNEMLYNDSTRFAEAARAAGVDVTLTAERDLWHVWQLMAPLMSEARASIQQSGEFINTHAAG
jgi:acetyl esterase/lipase